MSEYCGGCPDHELTITIPTEPTQRQTEIIARGDTSLPFTIEGDIGKQVGCEVVFRGEPEQQFAEVINRVELTVAQLSGLQIMRVNKRILSDCREILYGETHSHSILDQATDTTVELMTTTSSSTSLTGFRECCNMVDLLRRPANSKMQASGCLFVMASAPNLWLEIPCYNSSIELAWIILNSGSRLKLRAA